MSLEELEKELYEGREIKRKRRVRVTELPGEEELVRKQWGESDVKQTTKKTKWGLIIGVVVGFLIIIGAAGAFLYFRLAGSRNITLEVALPADVQVGVPFRAVVNYGNNSGNIIRNAKLNLELPSGVVLLGGLEGQLVITKDIGDIGDGSLSQELYNLVVVSGENSIKEFSARLSYQPQGLGSVFEERDQASLSVKEPGVSIDLVMPTQILSGEQFAIQVKYRNISPTDFSGLRLQLDYPSNFEYKNSTLSPNTGNSLWILGDLPSGSEGEFTVNGVVYGLSNSFFNISARLTMTLLGRTYEINRRAGSLSIAPSPLEFSLTLQGDQNYVSRLDDSLTYVLNYKNNSGVGLADVIVTAKLIGDMFDFATLPREAGLDFNSITNTITWNAARVPILRILSAGQSGSLSFTIRTKKEFPIRRLGDKNFTLKVEAQIESPTVPPGVAAAKTVSLAQIENKVAGKLDILSQAFFRDASSGILNSGPMPPKVNQATQYTVHWKLTNYSTDMRNIEVRTFLEPGVNWTGQVKSNIDSQPVFNERTREVVWLIDSISATKGVIGLPTEAIFQVQATPSIIHLNKYQPLIGQTTVRAFDTFVNLETQSVAQGVSTALPDDPTVGSQQGVVVQ